MKLAYNVRGEKFVYKMKMFIDLKHDILEVLAVT